MKQILLTIALTVLFSQQAFGASDAELQAAYAEFANYTNELFADLQVIYINSSDSFLTNLALQRLDGKLELNSRLAESIDTIATLGARTQDTSVDVSNCTEGASTYLETLRDQLLLSMETCLYDFRYEIGLNVIDGKWNDLVHLGSNYLACTRRAIQNCRGNAACGDQIIAEIEEKKTDMPAILNLYGAAMITSLDGVGFTCKDQILTEFNNRIADSIERISTCISRTISSLAPLMCTADPLN